MPDETALSWACFTGNHDECPGYGQEQDDDERWRRVPCRCRCHPTLW